MVQFLAGGKGEGKSKKLIELANQQLKTTDGHLVFIDDDRRHSVDLQIGIRFVETGKGSLSNYREFIGFVLGILSQNNDIKTIYVDGLTNILEKLDAADLVKLTKRLEVLSSENDVDFVVCFNWAKADLPEEVQRLHI